ncbi:MAG TPA: hypothetical protein VIU61_21280 [Kofleriaceae bacterium]
MMTRLGLGFVFLGACWRTPEPVPPPTPAEPMKEPVVDWARALATTHITGSVAYRSEGTVSFTVNMPREPDRARGATILPIRVNLARQAGQITGVANRIDLVDEVSPLWQVTVTSRDARYLAAQAPSGTRDEYPFDAIVILPARPEARLVTPPDSLPPDLAPRDVSAAIDLDDDDKADVLVWVQPIKEDYDQGGTYARTKTGWKSIYSWMPL